MDCTAIRNFVADLLDQWEQGILDERQVMDRAEDMWDTVDDDVVNLPDAHPCSTVLEALHDLSVLNWQLIIKQDLPAIRSFLNADSRETESAWRIYRAYWESTNLSARKHALQHSSFYITGEPPNLQ